MSIFDSQELQVAVEAARQASKICRSVQSSIDEAMEKEDRSPVTVADYASQAVICKAIRDAFPDDPIIAEEDSQDLRLPANQSHLERIQAELAEVGISASSDRICQWIDYGNQQEATPRCWTLDPIDGTKGFLRKEQFAVSLALLINGQIEVAVLSCPNLPAGDAWDNNRGALFYAVRGQGAFVLPLDQPQATPQTVRVSGTGNASMARMCESVESGHSDHSLSSQALSQLGIDSDPVRLDSQAKYGVVARGEADIYLRLPTRPGYHEKIWDHAGGVLVVEEAGGRVTDVDGKPLDFSLGSCLDENRGVVVTNGLLHDQVLTALKEVGV